MKLILPYPPSVNTYWRHVVMGRSARVLISKEGRAYRKAVGDAVKGQRASRMPGSRKLAVKLTAFPPDARARDLDNLPKAVLDALTHAGVWSDDSQIDALHILRGEKRIGGALIVEIEAIPMALEGAA